MTLSGHADSVEKIIWGGQGLLYSASRDRTIKVGEASTFNRMYPCLFPCHGVMGTLVVDILFRRPPLRCAHRACFDLCS